MFAMQWTCNSIYKQWNRMIQSSPPLLRYWQTLRRDTIQRTVIQEILELTLTDVNASPFVYHDTSTTCTQVQQFTCPVYYSNIVTNAPDHSFNHPKQTKRHTALISFTHSFIGRPVFRSGVSCSRLSNNVRRSQIASATHLAPRLETDRQLLLASPVRFPSLKQRR